MLPNPVFFGIQLEWYSFFHKLALIGTIGFFLFFYFKQTAAQYPKWKIIYVIVSLIVVGFLGARFFYALEHFLNEGSFPDKSLLFGPFSQGNLAWYGVIFVFVTLLPLLLLPVIGREPIKYVFDLIGIHLCLFILIVKQGCQFSGDGCHGIFTTLPWGMYYLHGAAPTILPVHPTPIYDSLFHLILFIFLFKTRNKFSQGVIGAIFFASTSFFNFFLEFIRINPKVWLGLTLAQLVYAVVFLLATFYLYQLKKSPETSTILIPKITFENKIKIST